MNLKKQVNKTIQESEDIPSGVSIENISHIEKNNEENDTSGYTSPDDLIEEYTPKFVFD